MGYTPAVRKLDVTLDQSWTYRRGGHAAPEKAMPGVLVLFSGSKPQFMPIRLGPGRHVFGRDGVTGGLVTDNRMSRKHAEISFDGTQWHVRDLGSRNGTFLDGAQVSGEQVTDSSRVLRVGDTLFGLLSDVRPYEGAVVELINEVVLGPTLREPWAQIEQAGARHVLHLTGESGSGKELAARHFHNADPEHAKGPFVAVNCATIPSNLAERLLFGAKKGAYSGAEANADGYLQAANGGTLFLDEIAELDLTVQAKLLRVLESKEVLPLGATKPVIVEVAICSATHHDLRARANAGSFRPDLYFRISNPTVRLPPLRERVEDIPWIVQQQLQKRNVTAHVSLVEGCLSRWWPGNVRELIAEIDGAAARAAAAGRQRVEIADLRAAAGVRLEGPVPDAPTATPPDDATIARTLREQAGNVARTARILGIHRTQLRRWVSRNQELVKSIATDDGDDESTTQDD
jgi:transcriptional regulator of acetoin/glycerol metabolism